MEIEPQKQNKKQYDWLKGYQFVKGKSGNPGGKKKGTKSLKTFAREYLERLPPDEKIKFLQALPEELVWRMSEGNPQSDVTSGGDKINPIPILPIKDAISTNNSNKEDTKPQ